MKEGNKVKNNLSFHMLWSSQAIANLGDSLYILAIVTLIYNVTGSAAIAGIFPIIRVSAEAISGIMAPMFLDRFALVLLLQIVETGQTVCFGLLCILYSMLPINIFFIIVLILVAVISILHGFSTPIRNSLIPRLVDSNYIVKANSFISTSDQTILLVGWSIGGLILVWLGIYHVLLIVVSLFILSTLAVFFIKDNSKYSTVESNRINQWDSIKEGWLLIWKSPTIRTVSMMEAISGIGSSIWAGSIIIVYVKEVLNKGENWWGFINASSLAGTIVGGLIVWHVSKIVEKRTIPLILVSPLLIGLLILSFSLISNPWFSLVIAFLSGLPSQLKNIAQKTLFQTHISPGLLPKFYSAFGTIILITYGISVIFLGWIADVWGARLVYLISALLFLFSACLALLINKSAPIQEQLTSQSNEID